MSVKVLGVVWDALRLKRPTDTLVMLALADHASHDGSRIFPSVRTLARMTRLSEREIQRTLRWLQGERLIHVVAEATRRRPREYRIDLAALAEARGDCTSPHDTSRDGPRSPEGRPTVTQGVTEGRSEGDPRSPDPSEDPSKDSSRDPSLCTTPSAAGEVTFEQFREQYPKKQAMEAAAREWMKLAPNAALGKRILEALAIQKNSEEWRREHGRFIPYAVTWLRGKRWDDQVPCGEAAPDHSAFFTRKTAGNAMAAQEALRHRGLA